jgi:ParB family transcriptional regulator, chromosome partitioning protein
MMYMLDFEKQYLYYASYRSELNPISSRRTNMAGTSLKAQAEDKSNDQVKKKTVFGVDPRALKETPGFNIRDYEDPDVVANIENFANAFAKKQTVPAIFVRVFADGTVSPIEGHCRRLGALLAIQRGFDVPFIDAQEFKGTDAECRAFMLRTGKGLKFKAIEVALGYLDLHDAGWTNVQIADDQGVTSARVEQLLLLAKAGPEVHELVRSGKVDAEAAINVIREHREKAADFLNGKYREVLEQGQTKVTRSTLKEWMPKAKVVSQVIDSVETLMAGLDAATRTSLAKFETMAPELAQAELQGKKVEIDAAVLIELIRANGAVTAARAAKDAKIAEAKAAASQEGLDLGGVAEEAASGDGEGEGAGAVIATQPYVGDGAADPLLEQAKVIVAAEAKASASLLQKQLKVSFGRAGNLLAALEAIGVVGPAVSGSKDRDVLLKA